MFIVYWNQRFSKIQFHFILPNGTLRLQIPCSLYIFTVWITQITCKTFLWSFFYSRKRFMKIRVFKLFENKQEDHMFSKILSSMKGWALFYVTAYKTFYTHKQNFYFKHKNSRSFVQPQKSSVSCIIDLLSKQCLVLTHLRLRHKSAKRSSHERLCRTFPRLNTFHYFTPSE